ncbi:MAG: DUF4282 domain-containing protein [Planctomycetota bacterium]
MGGVLGAMTTKHKRNMSMNESQVPKKFLESLFDLSFSQFITVNIIKVLYIIAIVLSAFVAMLILIVGLRTGDITVGLAAIILTPIMFFLYVICARIVLELIIVVFRIADHTRELTEHKQVVEPGQSVGEDEA